MSDDIRVLLRRGAEEHTYDPPDLDAVRRRARRRRMRGIAGVVVVVALVAGPAVAPTVVAQQECAAVGRSSGCEPGGDERLDNGAVLTVWDVGDGEPFVTVALADWTLVLEGPDAGLAREIAAGLAWSVDERGFLRLRSTTPAVHVGVGFGLRTSGTTDGGSLRIARGCPAGTAGLQMFAGAATWCTDGYLVEATGGSRAWQQATHDSLTIRPASDR